MKRESFVTIFILFGCKVASTVEPGSFAAGQESEARFVPPPPPFAPPLLYPVNAATGILVAIAIPVPLPDQSVFVSYNFEANYNMPNIPADAISGPLQRLHFQNPYPGVDPSVGGTDYDQIARKLAGDAIELDETTTEVVTEGPEKSHSAVERSLNDKMIFTRRGAYIMIEGRLNANGINGKKCLLLAICESANISLLDNNGIVGHVLHIVLTPSSSAEEKLPTEYLKAEKSGASGNCKKYERHCNVNILNLISKIL